MTEIKFNPQQQEAVDAIDGAYSVIANPGSGKSTVLLGRIEKLVREHNVSEKDLLAITFTRNTANHMIQELKKRDLHFINVGTFHSICGQILRNEGININPSNMIQEWQIDNCFKEIEPNVDTKDVMNFISYQKNYKVGVNDEFVSKNSNYNKNELKKFYTAYENMKKRLNKYDFDDYLLLCLDILEKNRGKYTFKYILVDEHQDSNTIQNELLKHWHVDNNVFVLSDPKQALYSFRGGNTEFSMNFDKYWKGAKVINIDTNYRSKKNIIEKSNAFIREYYKGFDHYADSIPFQKEDGYIETNSYTSSAHEAVEVTQKIQELIDNGTKLNDIAVLYRKNKHADYIESELKRKGIEYDIDNDSSFFKRREIAGIMSFLRLLMDTNDTNAMENIFKFRVHPFKFFSNALINDIKRFANDNDMSVFDALDKFNYPKTWNKKNAITFKRIFNRIEESAHDSNIAELIDEIITSFKIKESINEKYSHKPDREDRMYSLEVLKSFAKDSELKEFIEFVYSGAGDKKKKKEDAVKLMTIHRSKGLEFDNVFVVGVEDKEFPNEFEGVETDVEEESRLFYVAVTRSKMNLWVSEIGINNRFMKEYGYEHKEDDKNTLEDNDSENDSSDWLVF